MNRVKKIVVTGPESTGKTTLCKQLAEHYQTVYIPEYARTYVENLGRPYNYSDIEHIAVKQVELEKEFVLNANTYLFYDTFLIITKIWFLWCYNEYPKWIDSKIKTTDIHLYLLLNTDLKWEPDGTRENHGKNRQKLFELYVSELVANRLPYKIIGGTGSNRLHNAIDALHDI